MHAWVLCDVWHPVSQVDLNGARGAISVSLYEPVSGSTWRNIGNPLAHACDLQFKARRAYARIGKSCNEYFSWSLLRVSPAIDYVQ